MRSKILAGIMALFVIVGIVIVGVRNGVPSLFSGGVTPVATTIPLPNNAIARENALLGTTSWQINKDHRSTTQIQAYASAVSATPGQTLQFYVSTGAAGGPANKYRIDFYRLGWYSGLGGRLMGSTDYFPGKAQGYYNSNLSTIIGCPSCSGLNNPIGPFEANWQATNSYKIPNDWTSGIYLAKFTDNHDWQTYTTFTLTNPTSTSDYIAVTPDTTYAAYNGWGSTTTFSTSLYNITSAGATEGTGPTAHLFRSAKVSFNKPYPPDAGGGMGASQVLLWEIQAVRWMEQQNYNITYISDVDLQNNPGILLKHKAYISLGHDEYWTKEMRDGVEAARSQGVGLLFMGANASYWQMRFEQNNRWVVSYKVSTFDNNGKLSIADLQRDPLYGVDNTRVTALWRDQVVNRPENALVGIMFSDLVHRAFGVQVMGYPWKVAPTNSPLLLKTGLQQGALYGCGLVGYEWDKVFNNGHTPPNLQVIATSDTLRDAATADTLVDHKDFGNTTYYIANSGAMVFASGSIYWATALDNYRLQPDAACGPQSRPVAGIPAAPRISSTVIPGMNVNNAAVPQIQLLMKNVMDQLIIKHPAGHL
ncbi:MAG TPA: N,N-dimethylformamidase beta subunit family domain-containing protein [Ktedonosporobacter sp.]|nr:N,N-dimethylformamidase beta subunit family domain-containing protein [Ktedonosporobacter sp.]